MKRIIAFLERLAKTNGVVLTLLAIASAMVVGAFIIVLSDIEALASKVSTTPFVLARRSRNAMMRFTRHHPVESPPCTTRRPSR